MNRQSEIEIFIQDCPLDRALAWVQTLLGPLTGPFDDIGMGIYHLPLGSIVFTPGVARGRFLSVWFNTPMRPWDTDIDCARAAAVEFNLVVRCDPGQAYPELSKHSDQFLEITGNEERIVDWV